MPDMRPIEEVDPELAGLIQKEVKRQRSQIHLIASENYISLAMMQAWLHSRQRTCWSSMVS